MEIVLIAAIAENYVECKGYPIGKNGKIPWKIPEDIKRFKELTINHPVIMGRKTYESIGKVLPNRLNVVITSQVNYPEQEILLARSLDDAIGEVMVESEYDEQINYDIVYIIGGESLYKEGIEMADKLEITHVNQTVENADAFFPQIDLNVWMEDKRDDKEGYSFVTYQKR
ncbi:diacylglycerol kinase [Candidatus Woesearchaeota archaeon CG10_big_fil_rev_8_21_14_0_10_30_7]|nr:MAG: diacylglycerol kinase [Candidatus Woesearchaeota archaeon CG10_big_fil_rev_8_21_14_0_10_30_7]